MKICKISGCNNSAMYKDYGRRGYCCKHYGQIQQCGKILKRTKYDKNKIINCNDHYEICLYNIRHKEIARTKIDKEDLEIVKQYKWHLNVKGGYAFNKRNNLYLHRLILNQKDKFNIDHINHNKLDNRKQNLRFATYSQNNMNRKNVKGYYWCERINKWYVQIRINSQVINLGYFEKEKEAIKIRKQAEQKYFGEFAYK